MLIELRMLIDTSDIDALRQHALLASYAAGGPRVQQTSDTYFDTPAWHFRRAKAGLRVRRVGDICMQTLQAAQGGDAVLLRQEQWETRVAGPSPELAALRDVVKRGSLCGKLLRSPKMNAGLSPLFSILLTRTIWTLRMPCGAQVDCVLEVGTVACGTAARPIAALALELTSGDTTRLFELALGLQRDLGVHLASASNAERGYALLAPQPLTGVSATPLNLRKQASIEQALQCIGTNCMAHMLNNAAAVAAAHHVEALHQMRVAVRRLRAALWLFRRVLSVPAELEQELAWLGKDLGPARDCDVLLTSILKAAVRAAPADVVFESLDQALRALAQRKHGDAARAVNSARFTRLTLLIGRWIACQGWRDGMPSHRRRQLGRPALTFAHSVLEQSQRRLHNQGKSLRGAGQETRHRIRIAAKKARYAAQFFQSLLPEKRTQRYLNALTLLQDVLGRLNDAANADAMLMALPSGDARLIEASAFARGYLASCAGVDHHIAEVRWKKFVSQHF